MNVELFINHNNTIYQPIVEEGIMWETERKGTPGKLSFTVVKDAIIDFTEGDAVRLRVDGKGVFYGFVFTKKRDKEHRIKVTAYDQMRYLKNRYSYLLTNFTATQVIKKMASDYRLNLGYIEDTKYVMSTKTSTNTTFMDMIQLILDETTRNTGEIYAFYDDFGALTLKGISNMVINDIVVDSSNSTNFDYTSSIDEKTYNSIVVYKIEKGTGEKKKYNTPRIKYKTQSGENINRWGVLEHWEEIKEEESDANAKQKADILLSIYNEKTRHLNINNVLGDLRVRAGSLIPVIMHIGDLQLNNMMLVEKCRHEFYNDQHLMDLTLRGGIKGAQFEQ